jgi:hypothetical protein
MRDSDQNGGNRTIYNTIERKTAIRQDNRRLLRRAQKAVRLPPGDREGSDGSPPQ